MPSPSDADLGPLSSLASYLHTITEAPPASRTERAVIERLLTPTLQALGAVSGSILLVDAKNQQLKSASTQRSEDGTLALWQEESANEHQLVADVLRITTPLYVEDLSAFANVSPALQGRIRSAGAEAAAIIPLLLDTQPLGVIALGFAEPHPFTPVERRFLNILADQCAVAIHRSATTRSLEARVENHTRQLELERAALEVFVAFTEAASSETDLIPLAEQAIQVLRIRFPGASALFYELEDDLWKARIWSADVNPSFATTLAAGLPIGTPIFAQTFQSRQPVFTDAWDAQRERVASSEEYGAAALYPLIVQDQLHWLLAIGLRHTSRWSDADRSLIRAVGRSLNLALERTETARQLTLQNIELQARTRALEAFADLTRDLALITDPLQLIQRAQEVMMSMLPPGGIIYYEVHNGRWYNRVQYGSLQSPELQAAIDVGLPYRETSNLYIPWISGQPYYQDVYDHQTDDLAPPLIAHIGATVTFPVRGGGKPMGMLAIALFQQRQWSRADRVLLETAVQSLDLALERAAYIHEKETQQRAMLEARGQAEHAQQEAERHRSQAEHMTHLAHHDVLTGLPNRAGLSIHLREAIAIGTPFALFYVDLDGFKAVNDTLGHDAGDELLIQIAAVLRDEMMDSTAGHGAVARIGGDEFTIMISGVQHERESTDIARTLQRVLDRAFQVASQDVFISASTGITLFPADGQTPEDLLQNADLAMYQIKRETKNSWRHYRRGMNEEALSRLLLASDLRAALGRNEFQLYYQPQVDLNSGDVRCLEALLRWFPASGASVSPDRFIPAAEASGLIVPIGQWVLNTACAQLAVWRTNGFPDLKISVNVSPIQFARSDFVEVVQEALLRAELTPNALELELTERGVLADLPAVLEHFRALRLLGVQIALDDFGAGDSNFGRLLHLPFDVLKLDRTLTCTLPEKPETQRFMRALQVFASSLNLELVAEGIETPAQLEAVRTVGCHRAQGYLLGRPSAVWPVSSP